MATGDLEDARRWFAEDLRVTAPILNSPRLVEAFARVGRESFVGPGPWRLIPPRRDSVAYTTEGADPRDLYHCVLVVIDEARDLNNGDPRLWAYLLDHADLKAGEHVLQVGAGTGYYSAVLAEAVGRSGRVTAIEYDPELAARAKANLRSRDWVTVVHGDGTRYDSGPVDAIVVFAGATRPADLWLDRLRPGGRLLMPLTGGNGWGFFLRASRLQEGFDAVSLGPVGFFPCMGGRDADEANRLARKLRGLRGRPVPVRSMHRGRPPVSDRSVWYAAGDIWLSKTPPARTVH